MTLIKCDQCKKESIGAASAVVRLEGVAALSGILLPERWHNQDFCSVECFWKWAEKNNPKRQEQERKAQ